MLKNSNQLFSCICLAVMSFSASDVHAKCTIPDMRLYWSSVDNQSDVERDSHILLSFSPTEVVKVTLNGEELIAEELTRTHAWYAHPATAELGAQTLVITLDYDEDTPEESDGLKRPESVVITRTYNLIEPSSNSSDYEMSIVDVQPGAPHENDTLCDEIFNEYNCFDAGEPVVQDLILSTLEHPYFVETHSTTHAHQGEEQVWRPSRFYPKGCAASLANVNWESTCVRIVTIDEQGQRHVGAKQCGLTQELGASSCTNVPLSTHQPSHTLLWFGLFGMGFWIRRRRRLI